MLTIGDFRIHMINDGTVMMDAGGAFGLVPRALYSRAFMPPDDDNLLPQTLSCLVVQNGDKTILIDTGMGDKVPEKVERIFRRDRSGGGLVAGLGRLGLKPEDIDLVIDTHLHGDHAGGNTQFDENGEVVATFPNAEYVVQRREFEDAMQPNERTRATYLLENYEPLHKSGQLRLLEGDTDLAPGVRGVVTPGHTPGHMSVILESNGEIGMFVCDMATYAPHFEKLGWMTAYDVEPLVTLETKRKWQQWALDNNALLMFAHETHRKAGRATLDEKGNLRVDGIDVDYV